QCQRRHLNPNAAHQSAEKTTSGKRPTRESASTGGKTGSAPVSSSHHANAPIPTEANKSATRRHGGPGNARLSLGLLGVDKDFRFVSGLMYRLYYLFRANLRRIEIEHDVLLTLALADISDPG